MGGCSRLNFNRRPKTVSQQTLIGTSMFPRTILKDQCLYCFVRRTRPDGQAYLTLGEGVEINSKDMMDKVKR